MNYFRLFLIFIFVLTVALILEGTVLNFPIVFLIAAPFCIFAKKTSAYIAAFVAAFAIDSLRVEHFGMTAIAIFAAVFAIYFYEKYSGSADSYIAVFIVSITIFIYTYFLGYSVPLLIALYLILGFIYFAFNYAKKKNYISV